MQSGRGSTVQRRLKERDRGHEVENWFETCQDQIWKAKG